jgi:multidrug efflux system membrane fusion protein
MTLRDKTAERGQTTRMTTMTFDRARDTGRKSARRPTRRGLVIRLVIVALLAAALGGGLWFFNDMKKKAIGEFFASNVPPPTPVAAVPAEQGPLAQALAGIGTVTAIRQVQVAPEVAGRVVDIMFESGATVKKGDPLVQLNDAQQQADLASYNAQVRLWQTNLTRQQRLARNDFAAQATIDQNQAELDQAQAGIARTEALIAQKRITAPFDGVLGIRDVELGEYVGPGDRLVSLTDLDQLYVNFTLPEQARAHLEVGQQVEVTVDAFPGEVFMARLTTIEPQLDASTRAIRLQSTLDNPGRRLMPGMFAKVRLVLPPEPDVVTVPETALSRTLYGDSVFIVQDGQPGPNGEPTRKAVQTFVRSGEVAEGRVAILEGVKPGDLIVSSGALKLQNGAAVKVVESEALPRPTTALVE